MAGCKDKCKYYLLSAGASDNKIEGRLVVLDNSMKNLMVGVENILGVIGQNMGKNNQDGSQRLR